ncbi:MAG: hypothetical protein R3A13_04135 [Bdellovibrionota bacterium]
MHFVISAYGNSFVGMLTTTLYSVVRTHPEDKITVFWQDMDQKLISILEKTFEQVNFIQTSLDIANDLLVRIASKTLLWERAVHSIPDDKICLLDSDTLVYKNISPFFLHDFDVAFTVKPDEWPINTGVMLVKKTLAAEKLFTRWREKTLEVLSNPEMIKEAKSLDFPYGAPDQMSFYQLVAYQNDKAEFQLVLDDIPVSLRSFPCAQLNETRSLPVSKDTYIYHYKGGWRNILVEGDVFTSNRPKLESFGMYKLYLSTFKDALNELRKHNSNLSEKDLFISIPIYLEANSLEERKILYVPYFLWRKVIIVYRVFFKVMKKLAKIFGSHK